MTTTTLGAQLLEAYFARDAGAQMVKHQIDSYNDFVSRQLELIIDGFNPIRIHGEGPGDEIVVRVSNVSVAHPVIVESDGSTKLMLPNDARLRNLTYSGQMTADVAIVARTRGDAEERKTLHGVSLGKLPIMVRSRYCMLAHQPTPQAAVAYDECR
jgi:DNA-directed RNA polymerase beta subunit